ncbi:hypothetical protein JW933_10700 [candidate division FCPU426 bacterium]|nr:hypothetical protein [candidate division FCPU426 bacterium]
MPTIDQLKDQVKTSTQSSAANIEASVAVLRQLAAEQMEDMYTLMDSATLAAEQVQDKRLEILEQGPEVSAWEIFWDFSLTFILESPLAGKILHMFTKHLFIRRIRAHAFVKARLIKSIHPKNREFFKYLVADLKSDLKKMHRYMKILGDANGYERGPYPYLVALGKAVKETYEDLSRPSPVFEASDTPGVSILDMAQTYLSRQRLSIQLELANLEYDLRTGGISPEKVAELAEQEPLQLQGRIVSRQEMKDYLKRVFELLIWTMMLYQRPLTGKYVTTPRQAFTLKGYVQPSLINYWLKRFLNPDTGQPFSETPAIKRPDGKMDLEMATGELGKYMWNIAMAAKDNKVFLQLAGPLRPKEKLLKE